MSNGLHELLKNKLNKVEIDGQTFYVAEGDTLLDDEQLKIYAEVREQADKARAAAARPMPQALDRRAT